MDLRRRASTQPKWKARRPDGARYGNFLTASPNSAPAPGAAGADVLVDVRGVRYEIDGRAVFDSLDLTVRRGRITGIMGPSGTGKTTLLRLITAQIPAEAGEVIVWGRELATLSSREVFAMRKRMGMLFQNGALLTDMDVFENVAFPLREHADLPEPLLRTLVLTKLQAVGLRGAADLMPGELSGGMARRAARLPAVWSAPVSYTHLR